MTAHPPRVRWHVETYDDLAAEWSGVPETDRQTAVRALAHLNDYRPTWADGAPVQRRLVLETTTFEDMTAGTHPVRLPNGGFVFPCVGGQDLAALPSTTPDGRPAIRFSVGSSDTGHAEAIIPLEVLEEVIEGQREAARQASGQPAPGPCMCGHRKDQHVTVSGRLLCDSCDPDDTTATCTGYDAVAGSAEGAGA
ncbi:hypothetical protein [Streptomyces xanthophaeus]|uniref:hypothetical protein n=1 Tax=Streptomyces xanthophaeus TaxID=67385 RepID=UPI003659EC75